MTIREAMQAARKKLGNDDARFDALCLAEKAFGLRRTDLRLRGDQIVDPTEFFALISRRVSGEPLQYILGEWEFYGLRFAVGPGVLIPRPETEMLVELALNAMHNAQCTMHNAQCTVVDLCAGSGCVGLSVAHHCPDAQVYLVELSDQAMPYLRKNAAPYPNARVIQGDIANAQFTIYNAQLVLANPPYVKSGDLDMLQSEVRREPRMALDGGADGLAFYRVLAEKWLPRLAPGGLLACECGEGQARDIEAMFAPCRTEILKDFNGIDRVVVARRTENA